MKIQLLISLFILATISTQVKAKCEMTYEDLDNCALQSSLFGNPRWKTPENEEQLTQLCDDAKKSFQCIGTYVKTCMNTFAQTMFGLIQSRAKKDFKERCTDPTGRQEFIKHINCAKQDIDKEHVYNCVHGFLGQLNHQINIHASMSKEDRVITSCCSISQLHECLLDNVKRICSTSLDYWKSKLIMTEHMEDQCGKFQSVAACDANANASLWPKLKNVFINPEKEGVEIKYKSPITALIVYMTQSNA